MTNLGEKMRALAPMHPEYADELRAKASAFDVATAGYYGDPQVVDVKSFMGAYARARILYCKVTGDSLV